MEEENKNNQKTTTEINDTKQVVIHQVNNHRNTDNPNNDAADQSSMKEIKRNEKTNPELSVEIEITSCDKEDNNDKEIDTQKTTDSEMITKVDDINNEQTGTVVKHVNDFEENVTRIIQPVIVDQQANVVANKTVSELCNIDDSLRPDPGSVSSTAPIPQSSERSSNTGDNCVPNKLNDNSDPYFEPEVFKRRKLGLYAEDTGPKLYTVKCNNVTPPLIPSNLPEAFAYLPVHGRPKTIASIKDYLKNKVKEFVGGGLNDEEFDQLSKECNPDKLRTGDELVMPSSIPGTGLLPPHLYQSSDDTRDELCIANKHRLRMRMDTKNIYQKKLKYRGIRMIPVTQEEFKDTDTDETRLQPGKDLVFHVRLYRPTPYNPLEKQIKSRHSLFSCDMVLLGRQTLETLRDRIACASDVVMRVDVSHDPDNLPPNSSKDLFPSGFLFINNVFYVDGRDGCSDTSRAVREWAVKRNIGRFPHRDMSVRLDQLPVKLGHPDVYVHQGNCEHLLTFSDIRLLNATDPQVISQYPHHTSVGQNQTVYCTTCAEFGAKWIVVGSDRVPFASSFFCDTCFRLYFYKGKEKIGNFKAYAFRGNELNILKPQVLNFKNPIIH